MSDPRRIRFPSTSGGAVSRDGRNTAWIDARGDEVRPLLLRTIGEAIEAPPQEPEVDPLEEMMAQLRAEQLETERARDRLMAQAGVFAQAALELGVVKAEAARAAEAQLLDLAVTIASVLVEREVQLDPALHQRFVRAAIQTLGDVREARVAVSPDAHGALCEVLGDDTAVIDGVRVRFVLDPSIEGLGGVLQSELGHVDGRIDERLRSVRKAFDAELEAN
ncbi:MAG: flagellar assembly protein FliH [Myxococcales bacterium]|nr:flagellar assembly protein FliH [Myxococcales bacterium]